jgi:hypothetical protein
MGKGCAMSVPSVKSAADPAVTGKVPVDSLKYCNRYMDDAPGIRADCAAHIGNCRDRRGATEDQACETCPHRNIRTEVVDLRRELQQLRTGWRDIATAPRVRYWLDDYAGLCEALVAKGTQRDAAMISMTEARAKEVREYLNTPPEERADG